MGEPSPSVALLVLLPTAARALLVATYFSPVVPGDSSSLLAKSTNTGFRVVFVPGRSRHGMSLKESAPRACTLRILFAFDQGAGDKDANEIRRPCSDRSYLLSEYTQGYPENSLLTGIPQKPANFG